MYVHLPALPLGVYTVEYTAESAEDGHAEPGTFAFGVGMTPPSAGDPGYQPAGRRSRSPSRTPMRWCWTRTEIDISSCGGRRDVGVSRGPARRSAASPVEC